MLNSVIMAFGLSLASNFCLYRCHISHLHRGDNLEVSSWYICCLKCCWLILSLDRNLILMLYLFVFSLIHIMLTRLFQEVFLSLLNWLGNLSCMVLRNTLYKYIWFALYSIFIINYNGSISSAYLLAWVRTISLCEQYILSKRFWHLLLHMLIMFNKEFCILHVCFIKVPIVYLGPLYIIKALVYLV